MSSQQNGPIPNSPPFFPSFWSYRNCSLWHKTDAPRNFPVPSKKRTKKFEKVYLCVHSLFIVVVLAAVDSTVAADLALASFRPYFASALSFFWLQFGHRPSPKFVFSWVRWFFRACRVLFSWNFRLIFYQFYNVVDGRKYWKILFFQWFAASCPKIEKDNQISFYL